MPELSPQSRLAGYLLRVVYTDYLPARGCAADKHMVFANFCPIEHRVEGSHLIDTNRLHIKQLSHPVQRCQAKPPAVLLLHHIQHRDDSRSLIVRRVPRYNVVDDFIICLHANRTAGVSPGSVLH